MLVAIGKRLDDPDAFAQHHLIQDDAVLEYQTHLSFPYKGESQDSGSTHLW